MSTQEFKTTSLTPNEHQLEQDTWIITSTYPSWLWPPRKWECTPAQLEHWGWFVVTFRSRYHIPLGTRCGFPAKPFQLIGCWPQHIATYRWRVEACCPYSQCCGSRHGRWPHTLEPAGSNGLRKLVSIRSKVSGEGYSVHLSNAGRGVVCHQKGACNPNLPPTVPGKPLEVCIWPIFSFSSASFREWNTPVCGYPWVVWHQVAVDPTVSRKPQYPRTQGAVQWAAFPDTP